MIAQIHVAAQVNSLPVAVYQLVLYGISFGIALASSFPFILARAKRKTTFLLCAAAFSSSVAAVILLRCIVILSGLSPSPLLDAALVSLVMYSSTVMNLVSIQHLVYKRFNRSYLFLLIPFALVFCSCLLARTHVNELLTCGLMVDVAVSFSLYVYPVTGWARRAPLNCHLRNGILFSTLVAAVVACVQDADVAFVILLGYTLVLSIMLAGHVSNSENTLYCPMSDADAISEFSFVHGCPDYSPCQIVNDQKEELARIIAQLYDTNKLLTMERNVNESQKILYEKQSQDLKASIRYAQKIQKTMLKGEGIIRQHFDDYFIMDYPRDIVSGDFYWAAKKDDKIFIAVADCTGHGVPGAFMSIIGITQLNSILSGPATLSPSEILYKLRDHIITTFYSDGVDFEDIPKDGMDISLVSIDKTARTMEFAGAYNPVYLIRSCMLAPIKGDKNPIGIDAKQDVAFNNHSVKIEAGDVLYMFTDGVADQFGAKTGKKFKYNRMKEMFLEIHELPLEAQKVIIQRTINNWRGDLDQVDDMLVLGIKL